MKKTDNNDYETINHEKRNEKGRCYTLGEYNSIWLSLNSIWIMKWGA